MKRCSVGGQAVMEGVMMKNPGGGVALAVRKPDGTILTEYSVQQTRARKGTFWGLPVVRGAVVFVESLVGGMQTVTRSAELYGGELAAAEEPDRFERWLSKKLGKSAMDIMLVISVVLAIGLSVGLFFFLPTLISGLLFKIPGIAKAPSIVKNLVEGVIRLMIFIGYIVAISCVKDIRRVFMYHGAEHKTIACYEHEEEMTVANAMKHSRLHARCGTNYLFLVMAISILFFACLPYSSNILIRFATRLLFIPLVAGLSYEVLKLAAASDSVVARIVRAPGLALQKLTTREPEPEMIEVAIRAFRLAMLWDKPQDAAAKDATAEQEHTTEESQSEATPMAPTGENTEACAEETDAASASSCPGLTDENN